MLEDILKDMSKYLPSKIAPAIIGIVTIPIITHLFIPEEYGNYALVLATISILAAIVGWLPMSIIRFYPIYEKKSQLKEFYGTTIGLSVLSIGILFFIFTFILFFNKTLFSKDLNSLMRIGILIFVNTAFFQLLQHFLRAKRQVTIYSITEVWDKIGSICFGLILIFIFKQDIKGLLWGAFLSGLLILPFLWKICFANISFQVTNISRDLTWQMMKYGFPLVVGNLAAWILSLSDRYILDFIRNSREVGIYSVCYNISEHSIRLLVSLFLIASGPIGIRIWEHKGKKASQEFVSKLTRFYLIFCIPAIVGMGVMAKPLIKILTAQEYNEGYVIVPLVAIGMFFHGLQQRYHFGLLFYNKTYFIMIGILVSGILNIGLNLLFVSRYGYLAAAVTTLISYIFLFILMVIISRRFYVWQFPLKTLRKVIYASLIMGAIVYYIGNNLSPIIAVNLIVGIFTGLFLYFLALFLFKEFSYEEIQQVKYLKQKFIVKLSLLISTKKINM